MGNLNVDKNTLETLKVLAKDDDRPVANMVKHLANNEFRSRKVIKDENDRGQ
jgi:PleD family two-component response regulator